VSSYSIGQVARLAGVTIRTLHHYDEIGLLSPGDRSGAGYRRYGDAEIVRLQQVMFYRELGFSLEEIAALLDDPGTDPVDHLRRQHELLVDRRVRVQAMVEAVEKAMEAAKMGISLTPEERFEVFGTEDPGQYADEAQERWGDTEAYRQSQRRTKNYTKDDWLTIKAEAADIDRAFIEALTSGRPATGTAAVEAAERHRQHISRWFYDCSPEFHTGLADMYVADARFTENYERQAEGLAVYVHDAIHANADRDRLDPATA
jgi:DNA-binding transcriptional MerR regulator